MIRKSILFNSLLLLFLFSTPAIAQKSKADKDPLSLFRMGVELYEANHFAAAQKVFRDYLEANDNRYGQRADAQYYIAISAMELFQNDAEALLTQFTNTYPEHPKSRLVNYYMGKFQFRDKHYEKAAASFEKVDESDLGQKERYEYYFMSGYANYKAGDKAKAKEMLAKVKDAENENKVVGTFYYAVITYDEGNYKEALTEFNKIKDDKKYKNFAFVYLTQIYLLQARYDKVIEYGEQALAVTDEEGKGIPGDKLAEVRRYVAEAYFMQKNYEKAAFHYGTLMQEGQTLSNQQLYQLGYAQYLSGDYAGAINSFSRIPILEDSMGQNVAYHMAGAYVKTGDLIKARNSYSFASRLKFLPKLQENALLNYAKLSYEQNYQSEAIDAFKSFISKYPKSPDVTEANELLSQILLASDNPKEALEVLKGLPSRTGKLAEAYQKVLYLYGLELFKNRSNADYLDAEKYFKESLENPVDKKTKALAYFWLAETQYRLSRPQDAMANYKNFLYVSESKQTPYYALAYYNLGYCYFKNEDYTQAKNYFNQYLEHESNAQSSRATDATLRAADCNFALKSYPQALTGYDQVIRKNAAEADYAYYQKGIIQGLRGNNSDKVSTMRSLVSSYKNSAYVDDALFSIGEAYMNDGNFSQAIKEFQNLNRDYPKSPYYLAARLSIGQLYIAQKQDDKAIPIFKNIISTYPSSAEAKAAVRFIQNSYIDRGLTDSLELFYKSSPQLVPSSQDSVLYASAFSNVKKNDCPNAIKSLEKYLTSYPNGYFAVDANYFLAECYYKKPSPAKAQQHYNFVIARNPNPYMEQSITNSAEIYFNDKDYTMAAKRYEQLEDIASTKDLTLYSLQGQLRSQFFLSNYDKTLEVGNRILSLGYADDALKTEAQYNMGRSYLALNQNENAMASFTQVQKSDKAEMGAEASYEIAHIYFLQEKYEDSRKAVMLLKDQYAFYDYWRAKGFILLSDIYVKMGDNFQAKSTLQSIIDNYDGDDDIVATAKTKLEEIKKTETGK